MSFIRGVSQERSPKPNDEVLERLGNDPVFIYCASEVEGIVASQLIGMSISEILNQDDKIAIDKIKKLTAVASGLYGEEYAETLSDVRRSIQKDFKPRTDSVFAKTAIQLQKVWSRSVFDSEKEIFIPGILDSPVNKELIYSEDDVEKESKAIAADTLSKELGLWLRIQSKLGVYRNGNAERMVALDENELRLVTDKCPEIVDKNTHSYLKVNDETVKNVLGKTMSAYEEFSRACESFLEHLRVKRESGSDIKRDIKTATDFLKLYATITRAELRSGTILSGLKNSSKGMTL